MMEVTNEERLQELEKEVVDLKIRMSVNELAIGELKTTVHDIKANTNRIVWMVGTVIIMAVLNLIIKGGVSL